MVAVQNAEHAAARDVAQTLMRDLALVVQQGVVQTAPAALAALRPAECATAGAALAVARAVAPVAERATVGVAWAVVRAVAPVAERATAALAWAVVRAVAPIA